MLLEDRAIYIQSKANLVKTGNSNGSHVGTKSLEHLETTWPTVSQTMYVYGSAVGLPSSPPSGPERGVQIPGQTSFDQFGDLTRICESAE